MSRHAFALCMLIVFTAPAWLLAEQEVTLKSGASFIGNVTLDGDAVVVEVDEAKLMNNTGKEVLALLAEASRLDPEDPKIAYWYATSLVDAGFGKAASEVFALRREDIANAYPGMSDQLEARIKQRLELEKMPAAIVERIDTLYAANAPQAEVGEMRRLVAVFRLVDQNQQPIKRSAFHIESNGQEDNLESFADGYYLFTFNQSRPNRDQPCRLEVNRPGLESKTFQFTGGWPRFQNAGEFLVHRYDESAKKPFRVHVVDADGQPIANANLTFYPQTHHGNSQSDTIAASSDDEGRAEIRVFPMKYSYRVDAEGFTSHGGDMELRAAAADADEQPEKRIKLYRSIRATIRVAWITTTPQDGAKSTGEAVVQVAGGPSASYNHNHEALQWLRPTQGEDKLMLHLVHVPSAYQGPFASDVWVRVAAIDEQGDDEATKRAAMEKFKELDINKLEALKDELSAPDFPGGQPSQGHGPIVVPATEGMVYVGKLSGRDGRTGQPSQVAFKLIVETMTDKAPRAK